MTGNPAGGPYLDYSQFHETFADSNPPVLPHAGSGTGTGTGSPISSTNPIPPGGWVPLGYDPFCTSEDSSNWNQCVVCNQCAAISEDAAAAQSAGTGLFSFVIDFTRAFASAVPPAPEGDWELAPDAVDAIMAEAGSGDPLGKTDAFLRSARGSKTSRGAIDSIMADHGRSGTSFWGSIGSFFSSEVLPRVGGVVQAGWGLLQMNLGFGLIVGSGFAEGLSGGTLTPLAIVGAVGGGMLALHGSGDLWAGMQTAWDGKPHENMANTLARDVAKSLVANDPDWWANSFDAASVGLAWVAPAVQPRPEFPKLYPESPGPKPVKPPWEAPSAEGTLTAEERAEIQAIANKHRTTIDVVGSRAAGEGRNIGSDLPVGKGPGTRSDIDFRIDTSHPQADELISDLQRVGNGAGNAGTKWGPNQYPTYPPFIRFTPQ